MDERGGGASDALFGRGVIRSAHLKGRFVAAPQAAHRAAVDAPQQAFAVELAQVAAGSHVADVEMRANIGDGDSAVLVDPLDDFAAPFCLQHFRGLSVLLCRAEDVRFRLQSSTRMFECQ